MKIKGTDWYTAVDEKRVIKSFHDDDEESPTYVPVTYYGYRRSVQGKSETEIKAEIEDLKRKGIEHIKLKKSMHAYTGIPAGTFFLQVLDEDSVIALEKSLLKEGIDLPTDRYKEYGLKYINRPPSQEKTIPKLSIWKRLFGGRG